MKIIRYGLIAFFCLGLLGVAQMTAGSQKNGISMPDLPFNAMAGHKEQANWRLLPILR